MSVYEAGMLICFGVSWPLAAYKTYKAKCVHGKSIWFSLLILLGYVCGIINKLLYSYDIVLALYLLNVLFLLIDMGLWVKYRHNVPINTINPAKEEVTEINEEVELQ